MLRRKPQSAVARANARGLDAAVAFGVEHSVDLAVNDRSDRADFSVGEIWELLFAHAIDAQVATHPEIALRVLQDPEDAVVEQAVVRRDVGDLPVLDPAQPAVVCADPDRARAVFV